ncbi:hypothetical protein [Streptosporangium sp. OZ121]|uniref:hypothetical protein n=1 Tax=Streptosporangium sp. OZ121 TaxID=3444183 RepID=UPI003F79353C
MGGLSDQLRALDEDTASVYFRALHRGRIGTARDVAEELGLDPRTVEDAIERLTRLHLLRPEPGHLTNLVPVNPEIAAASLISPMETEIHHRRDLITGIRTRMHSLMHGYDEVQRTRKPANPVEALPDGAAVRGSLHLAAEACEREMLSVEPNAPSWADLDDTLTRNLAMLERGVRMRMLYQHSARADLPTRGHIKKLVAAGASVRTTPQLPNHLVIFDGEVAFMSRPGEAGAAPGAVAARDLSVVGFLSEVFEHLWNSATPYSASDLGYQGATDEIQHAIVTLLAQGFTDEAVARRLGMSVRTCRRHIGALLQNLSAVSRFQAGIRAAASGYVDAR